MSIEALIKAHMEALQENTMTMRELKAYLSGVGKPLTVEIETAEIIEAIQKEEKPKVEAKEVEAEGEPKAEEKPLAKPEGTSYGTVRGLVLALAANHRDAIKALNAKHGLTNLKDLLENPEDFNTVKDQPKLDEIYGELLKLGA